MSKQFVAALAVLAACAAFFPDSADAAPKRARLTIDVKADGTEGVVGNGSDRTSGKFRESYTFVTFVETDGELAQFNAKDPEYAQKMMGLSQNVHAQVNAAKGKAPARKMTQAEIAGPRPEEAGGVWREPVLPHGSRDGSAGTHGN